MLIEDDKNIAETVAQQLLLLEEFCVDVVSDAKSGLDLAKAKEFDLILLDIGLPDQDGRETCRLLRKLLPNISIVLLTGFISEADIILGLEAGADDYITKPFRFGELLARIRVQLRKLYKFTEEITLRVGEYKFKPRLRLLIDKIKEEIRLTEKETNILMLLYEAKQSYLTRQDLLKTIWGYQEAVSTHTLETHIYRLRQKIERNPSSPNLLITYEKGYRLNI